MYNDPSPSLRLRIVLDAQRGYGNLLNARGPTLQELYNLRMVILYCLCQLLNGGVGCRQISTNVGNSLIKEIKMPHVGVMVLSHLLGVEVMRSLYRGNISGSPCSGRSGVSGGNRLSGWARGRVEWNL